MTHLSFLRLRNIKGFIDAEAAFQPLTVLIGPNNAGKSSLLQFLRFLGSFEGEQFAEMHLPDRWNGWVRRDDKVRTWGATLKVQDLGRREDVAYSFDLERGEGKTLSFVNEEFADTRRKKPRELAGRISPSQIRWQLTAPSHQASLLHFPEAISTTPFREFRAFVSGIRVFGLDSARLREASTVTPAAELGPDGSGLAATLDRIRSVHPDAFARIEEELRRTVPEVKSLLTPTVGNGEKAIGIRETSGQDFDAAEISDGVLLTTALLTLVHQPEPPTVLCLEEPENGLHPRRLADVVDLLTRLAYPEDGERGAQVILTTHSPYVVDLFRDRPENVLVVDRNAVGSTIRTLEQALSVVHGSPGDPLGELWYSGVLGGVGR